MVDRKNSLNDLESTFVGDIEGLVSPMAAGECVLSVLSGKSAGKQSTFLVGQSILIGRQEDCHIRLDHNLVSRHHTKIVWKGSEPWVVDLSSTNGTFQNGEKIEETRLNNGDRIQIGNSVIKFSFRLSVEGEETRLNKLYQNAEKLLHQVEDQTTLDEPIFSGQVGKIPLSEILQSLCLSQRDGILVIKSKQLGKIYLDQGRVFRAKVDHVKGKKALFRILSWDQGSFELRELDDEWDGNISKEKMDEMKANFGVDFMHTLLEFLRCLDEFQKVKEKAPKLNDSLALNPQKPFPNQEGLDRVNQIYRAAQGHPKVSDLLNQLPFYDTEILRVLTFFIERGYLQISTSG